MEQYAEVVLDLEGNAVPGATVQVLAAGGAPASLFDKNGNLITGNTVTTGSRGEFAFQTPNGKYTLLVTVRGSVYATVGPLTFYDPADDTRFNALDTTLRPDLDALEDRTAAVEQEVDGAQTKLQTLPAFADKGATPTGDATAAIQAALDVGHGFVGDAGYEVSAPLKLPSMSAFRGARAGIAFTGNVPNVKRAIKKVTNTTAAIKNFQSNVTSNIDCILFTNPNWIDNGVSYPQDWVLEGFALRGNQALPNHSAIYHEQGSGLTIRDMQISGVVHALYAKELWSSSMQNIKTNGKIAVLGGTSLTFTNIGFGASGNTSGGFSMASLIYSTFIGCWADGTTETPFRFVNSEVTLINPGCEGGTTVTANSGTMFAWDGGNKAVVIGKVCVPKANQVLPISAAGFDNTIVYEGGTSSYGVAGVNCPDEFVWGNNTTIIYNDHTFVNGTKDNPVIQFATGVTTSKVIVNYGTNTKIYTSDGAGATLVKAKYDSGTFTPQLTFGGASVGMQFASRSGKWQVSGGIATVSGQIQLQQKGSSTGVAQIGGWPNLGSTADAPLGFSLMVGVVGGPLVGTINAGSAIATLSSRSATGDASAADGNFTDTTLLWFIATFPVGNP